MKVAVGIICNINEQILITQRALNIPHGGKWEFPGGKLEEGETPFEALKREIHEEVSLHVIDAALFCELQHDYGNKPVHLLVYLITNFKGIAKCSESQLAMKWVNVNELHHYDFPEANQKLITQLQSRLLAKTPQ